MPIHEFECTTCGNRFERLQKLSDSDPSRCPSCGKGPVHRRLSAPTFRLAGNGWYETDFKKAGDKKHHLADKGDAPKDAPKTETKADAKADVKGDVKPAPKTTATPTTKKPSGDHAAG